MNIVNPSKLSDGIINIGKLCASYSVKGIIPSILTKHNILTKTIREDNDKLKEKCHLDTLGSFVMTMYQEIIYGKMGSSMIIKVQMFK